MKLTFGLSWAGLWNRARFDVSLVAVTGFGKTIVDLDALPSLFFGVNRPGNFLRPGVRRFGVRALSRFINFLQK